MRIRVIVSVMIVGIALAVAACGSGPAQPAQQAPQAQAASSPSPTEPQLDTICNVVYGGKGVNIIATNNTSTTATVATYTVNFMNGNLVVATDQMIYATDAAAYELQPGASLTTTTGWSYYPGGPYPTTCQVTGWQ